MGMKAYRPLALFSEGDDLPLLSGNPDVYQVSEPEVEPAPPTHEQLVFEAAINEAHEASRKAGGEYEAMEVWASYRPRLDALRP